jgi:hypothetical protein
LRRELVPLDIAVTYVDPGAVDTGFMTRAGMPGAPRNVLVSPELVARKILLAVMTRPRVLNVAPLQTAAVTIAEMFPAITDVVLEMNPALIGAGPSLTAIEMQRDANGRGEKIALPSARVLAPPDEDDAVPAADETVDEPAPIEDDIVEVDDDEVVAQPVAEPVAAATAVERAVVPDAPLPRLEPAPVPPPPPAPAPVDATEEPERQFTARWQFEPPDADADDEAPSDVPAATAVAAATALPANGAVAENDEEHEPFAGVEPTPNHDIEPPVTTRSFDAALESLHRRMERAKLSTDFVRSLLVVDTVIDVGEAAMRWAGMPNKHERALTTEVFFALAEWGFLAPRADGRYRVLYGAEDDPAV